MNDMMNQSQKDFLTVTASFVARSMLNPHVPPSTIREALTNVPPSYYDRFFEEVRGWLSLADLLDRSNTVAVHVVEAVHVNLVKLRLNQVMLQFHEDPSDPGRVTSEECVHSWLEVFGVTAWNALWDRCVVGDLSGVSWGLWRSDPDWVLRVMHLSLGSVKMVKWMLADSGWLWDPGTRAWMHPYCGVTLTENFVNTTLSERARLNLATFPPEGTL